MIDSNVVNLDGPTGTIIEGNALEVLGGMEAESVDCLITDPPYGYSFMGKDWDRAVPDVAIWKECLRVLKPGSFAFIMSAPRLDVQSEMARRIQEAGFNIAFTPLYWTYATGFPKAQNMSKAVDKRLGVAPKEIRPASGVGFMKPDSEDWNVTKNPIIMPEPTTPQARALDGSYAGFQPKPAVEVIMVAMKPLSERTYVDQALANGKGVTWLDDCGIPTNETVSNHSRSAEAAISKGKYGDSRAQETHQTARQKEGRRFPANLLVSDDVLGEYSRYFSLDKWAATLPFLVVPKASKSERNRGCEKNDHPTVKPLKLMAYLVTLGSRPGDVVLDPFVGSGTTCMAAKELGRQYIGIEMNPEYAKIANARLEATGVEA